MKYIRQWDVDDESFMSEEEIHNEINKQFKKELKKERKKRKRTKKFVEE